MGSKKQRPQIAGYWYSAGIHLVFCHKLDSLEAIVVGEKTLWYPGQTEWYDVWESYACCRPTMLVHGEYPAVVNPAAEPHLPPCIENYSIADTCWHYVAHSRTVAPVTSSQRIYVNNLNLFGGEDKYGGVQGYIDVEFGEDDQTKNDYLLAHTNGNISAHRNVFGMVLRGVTVSCNTPQMKDWAIRGKRMTTNDSYRTDIQELTSGMNPAHIIRDCLTDVAWGGLGLDSSVIASFDAAAVALDNEGLGLSFIWRTNESLAAFINTVLAHINGMLFESYQTGLFTLKLLRDDYGSIAGLPVLNTSNILSLESFDVKSTEEAINSCTIKFTNPTLDKDDSVTVSDAAAVERMGGEIVLMEKEYFGCRNSTVAVQIANRELNLALLPLASATIVVNRSVYDLDPGDVFAFSWEPYGFEDVVMRVTAIDYGSTESNVIRVDAIMDVFAFGDVMISPPDSDGEWDDPNNEPTNLTNYRIEELTYYQAATEHYDSLPSVDVDSCYIQTIVSKETDDMLDYEYHNKLPSDLHYVLQDTPYFSDFFQITEALVKENSSLLKLNASLDASLKNGNVLYEGSFGYLGDELVMISAFTEEEDEIWVARGIIDTVPVEHAIGTEFRLCSGIFHGFSNTEYVIDDEVNVKLLPSTFIRRLTLDEATELSHICVGRAGKPYAPGSFIVNSEFWPEYVITNVFNMIELAWAHRDKTQQIGDITPQEFGDIGPETDVVYNLRVYDELDTLLGERVAMTDTSLSIQLGSSGSQAVKTFIMDIADNWGDTGGVGIRSVEFKKDGTLLPMELSVDFTAAATSEGLNAENAFNEALSKTGIQTGGWLTSNLVISNQRLYCVFTEDVLFDEIIINNFHHSGTDTDKGAKNVVITLSSSEVTSTVYNEAIPDSTVVYDGEIPEHTGSDVADDQIFYPYSNTAKSIIIDIADGYGAADWIGMRSVEFSLGGVVYELSLSTDIVTYYSDCYSVYNTDRLFDNIHYIKTGGYTNQWLSNQTEGGLRLICVFNTPIEFTEIIINNSHSTGTHTDTGSKNISVSMSSVAITDTTYNANILDGVLLYSGELAEHVEDNIADDQFLFEGASASYDADAIQIDPEIDWFRVELESELDGIISHNIQETENIVVGYGKHYGRYYGTRPS